MAQNNEVWGVYEATVGTILSTFNNRFDAIGNATIRYEADGKTYVVVCISSDDSGQFIFVIDENYIREVSYNNGTISEVDIEDLDKYSKAEVDDLISGISGGSANEIVDDFTTGGVDKAASAETVKLLKGFVEALESDQHTHPNKMVLDNIESAFTNSDRLKFDALEVSLQHAHLNKSVLDGIEESYTTAEQTKLNNLDPALQHNHTNKSVLDDIESAFTDTDRLKFDSLSNNPSDHNHTNKSVLDDIESAFTDTDRLKFDSLSNNSSNHIFDSSSVDFSTDLDTQSALSSLFANKVQFHSGALTLNVPSAYPTIQDALDEAIKYRATGGITISLASQVHVTNGFDTHNHPQPITIAGSYATPPREADLSADPNDPANSAADLAVARGIHGVEIEASGWVWHDTRAKGDNIKFVNILFNHVDPTGHFFVIDNASKMTFTRCTFVGSSRGNVVRGLSSVDMENCTSMHQSEKSISVENNSSIKDKNCSWFSNQVPYNIQVDSSATSTGGEFKGTQHALFASDGSSLNISGTLTGGTSTYLCYIQGSKLSLNSVVTLNGTRGVYIYRRGHLEIVAYNFTNNLTGTEFVRGQEASHVELSSSVDGNGMTATLSIGSKGHTRNASNIVPSPAIGVNGNTDSEWYA